MAITDNKTTQNDIDNARFDVAVKNAAARKETERKGAPRERKSNMGGMRLKLSVQKEVEGYHLYWENDDAGAIETLLYDGFEFVAPLEVDMELAIVPDTDLGNRVSRYVGIKADGTPMRAYLLKCSNAVWQERENYRYEQADARDSDIRNNRVEADANRYIPKGFTNTLNTQFKA